MKSKTFCALPWIHIATRPNGDVRLCCTANASGAGTVDDKVAGLVKKDGVAMNLRDHTLDEVWNSDFMKQTRLQMLNGEIPDSCRKCFVEESNGIVSKRQWETESWASRINLQDIVDGTKSDGSLPLYVPYFDLRLGNTCQLKCVMCSPHDSSSWIKEWKIQYPKYKTVELKQDQGWDENFDYTWYKKGSFLDTMKDQSNNIKELYFAGGEPLITHEHYKILEFMVETGSARNCYLRYNSNGVEMPDKLFELWSHFKEVRFSFSVDAFGDKNDYIRYPSKWNTIVENLHRLDQTPDNVSINIACAVQLLNVLYLDELAQWKIDQNFKKINLSPFGGGVIGTHLVYLPSYLNVRVLPLELKNLAVQRINDFCQTMSNNTDFMNSPAGYQRWQGLAKYMLQEDWSDKLSSAVEYLEVCDSNRSTNFREVFKDLSIL